jgi:hypothetical protein
MPAFMSLKLKFCSTNLFPESPTSSFCETPEHDDEESQRTVDQVDEVRNQVQPEKKRSEKSIYKYDSNKFNLTSDQEQYCKARKSFKNRKK